jgi:serine protease
MLWESDHSDTAYATIEQDGKRSLVPVAAESKEQASEALSEIAESGSLIAVSWVRPLVVTPFQSSTPTQPTDQYFSSSWALPVMNIPPAWSVSDGTNVTIAVIDSGISPTAELPRLLPGRNFVFDAGHPSSSDTADSDGHGTAVASIAAAAADGSGMVGAAPMVSLLPVRVLGNTGSGDSAGLTAGILYAVDAGARVLNLSLGVSGYDYNLTAAVAYAAANNVLIVAAAGNGGSAATPPEPAANNSTLAVAATNASNQPASFSQTGSYIDVAAPGVDILGLHPTMNYALWSGTSMATPLVAALAAVLLSEYPSASLSQLRSAIVGSAIDVYDPGTDTRTGAGIPRATEALSLLASALGQADPFATTTTTTTSPPVTTAPATTTTTLPPVTTAPATTTTTSPPTTSPPVTSPPATSPPVTSPPATSPPDPGPPEEPAPTTTIQFPPARTYLEKPAGLKATFYSTAVILTWTAVENAESYSVTRVGASPSTTTSNYFTDPYRALTPGTYMYVVQASSSTALSSTQASVTVVVSTVPASTIRSASIASRRLTVAVNPNKRLPAGSVWVLFVDNVQVARTSMSKSTASVRVSKGLHRVKIRIETPTGVSAYSASRSLLAR